ncbi:hypothetical protein SDC9_108134 [bioreactor metagenome]|uniref:Uncharacterized protein n=1 Tax=bioreactor metagenome TaxID=1076179 RepID=A0A645B892_9ZZZZ
MSFISKIISNIITISYGIICMPILVFIAIFWPIFMLSDCFKIINTGYTVTGDYLAVIWAMLLIMYISLRLRPCRRLYFIFPSLYETLKFLIIANMFIGIGVEILNWSYIELTTTRKVIGIFSFILMLVLWRVFVSIYYRKKPISKIMLEDEEKMQNYNKELS